MAVAACALLLGAPSAHAISFKPRPPSVAPSVPYGHACLNYPPEERRVGRQGDMTLDLWVEKSGRVSRAWVVHSSGDASLDKAALACVAAWTYPPLRHKGRLVTVQRRVMVRWVLTTLHMAPSRSPVLEREHRPGGP